MHMTQKQKQKKVKIDKLNFRSHVRHYHDKTIHREMVKGKKTVTKTMAIIKGVK